MSCTLAEAITREERLAMLAVVRRPLEVTVPVPDTHGVVLLSTRDSVRDLPIETPFASTVDG